MMNAAASTCGKPGGSGMHSAGRRDGVGAEAAGAGQARDVLAHAQLRHAFSHGGHHAGVLGTGHERQRGLHLVLVLHDQQVGEVEAGRLDFHQHFPAFGCGAGSSFHCSASTPVGSSQSQANIAHLR
jgi:hypothetical protein